MRSTASTSSGSTGLTSAATASAGCSVKSHWARSSHSMKKGLKMGNPASRSGVIMASIRQPAGCSLATTGAPTIITFGTFTVDAAVYTTSAVAPAKAELLEDSAEKSSISTSPADELPSLIGPSVVPATIPCGIFSKNSAEYSDAASATVETLEHSGKKSSTLRPPAHLPPNTTGSASAPAEEIYATKVRTAAAEACVTAAGLKCQEDLRLAREEGDVQEERERVAREAVEVQLSLDLEKERRARAHYNQQYPFYDEYCQQEQACLQGPRSQDEGAFGDSFSNVGEDDGDIEIFSIEEDKRAADGAVVMTLRNTCTYLKVEGGHTEKKTSTSALSADARPFVTAEKKSSTFALSADAQPFVTDEKKTSTSALSADARPFVTAENMASTCALSAHARPFVTGCTLTRSVSFDGWAAPVSSTDADLEHVSQASPASEFLYWLAAMELAPQVSTHCLPTNHATMPNKTVTSNTRHADTGNANSGDGTGASNTGAADTGASDTWAADTVANATGATDTGATTTGAVHTRDSNTGAAATGANDTEATTTIAAHTGATTTGASNTGAATTGVNDTGATTTGAAHTVVAHTEAPHTGASDTGASSTGASDTAAAHSGAVGAGDTRTRATATMANATGASTTEASIIGANETGDSATRDSATGNNATRISNFTLCDVQRAMFYRVHPELGRAYSEMQSQLQQIRLQCKADKQGVLATFEAAQMRCGFAGLTLTGTARGTSEENIAQELDPQQDYRLSLAASGIFAGEGDNKYNHEFSACAAAQYYEQKQQYQQCYQQDTQEKLNCQQEQYAQGDFQPDQFFSESQQFYQRCYPQCYPQCYQQCYQQCYPQCYPPGRQPGQYIQLGQGEQQYGYMVHQQGPQSEQQCPQEVQREEGNEEKVEDQQKLECLENFKWEEGPQQGEGDHQSKEEFLDKQQQEQPLPDNYQQEQACPQHIQQEQGDQLGYQQEQGQCYPQFIPQCHPQYYPQYYPQCYPLYCPQFYPQGCQPGQYYQQSDLQYNQMVHPQEPQQEEGDQNRMVYQDCTQDCTQDCPQDQVVDQDCTLDNQKDQDQQHGQTYQHAYQQTHKCAQGHEQGYEQDLRHQSAHHQDQDYQQQYHQQVNHHEQIFQHGQYSKGQQQGPQQGPQARQQGKHQQGQDYQPDQYSYNQSYLQSSRSGHHSASSNATSDLEDDSSDGYREEHALNSIAEALLDLSCGNENVEEHEAYSMTYSTQRTNGEEATQTEEKSALLSEWGSVL